MSADLNTEITLEGNKKELLAFIKVLRVFERDRLKQYEDGEGCAYIESVELDNGLDNVSLEDLTLKEIREFISDCEENSIQVECSGPYGKFGKLSETGLFEALADAAPKASFDGQMTGFTSGGDIGLDANFGDGELYVSEFCLAYEDRPNREDFEDEDEYEYAVDSAEDKNTSSYRYYPETKQVKVED